VSVVWYVAYGSNMVPERLGCYLAGGTPPGATRRYLGARDPSPPRRSLPVTVPHRILFAGVSRVWGGGGVAFVEARATPGTATPAVAHLLTIEQLADLVEQENGGEAPGPQLGHLPGAGERHELTFARYDLLVGLEPIEGLPAVLLTSSRPPLRNDPSPAYAEMLRLGRELFSSGTGAT
jgi:hypothetical protein